MVSRDDRNPAQNVSAMSNLVSYVSHYCDDGMYAGGGGEGGGGFAARRNDALSARRTSLSQVGPPEENSMLDGAAPDQARTDALALPYGPQRSADGHARITLRRGEHGQSHIASARLIAVDDSCCGESRLLPGRVVVGPRSPAAHVRRASGEDVTASVLGDPVAALHIDVDDTLLVDLGDGDYSGSPFVLEACARYGGEAAQGMGVTIQATDGQGGWRTVRSAVPRENLAEVLADSIGARTLRVLFKGPHRVSFIGSVPPEASRAIRSTIAPLSATHSALGELEASALAEGGTGADLAVRDTLTLSYIAPAPAEGMHRSWFLEVTGWPTSEASSANSARAEQFGTESLPAVMSFTPPRPNPSSAATRLRFELPTSAQVRIEVFDVFGRRVATLADGRYEAGVHDLDWSRARADGGRAGAGIYLARMTAGRNRFERKLVLLQ